MVDEKGLDVVYKHNKMIEGRVKFNELQQKIFFSLLYKIQQEESRTQYRFLPEEVRETLGLTKDFNRFIESLKDMQNKQLIHWDGNTEIVFNLFSKLEIDHDLKEVVVEVHSDLKALLFDRLKSNDTRELQALLLRDFKKLSGEYVLRFYELMFRFRDHAPILFTLENFRRIIDCDYEFSDLNKRMKKWIEAINQNTCIEVYKYRAIRENRKVARLAFYIREQQQLTLQFEAADNWVRELFARNGLEVTDYGCKALETHSKDALQYAIGEYKIKAQKGFRGNAVGYIDKVAKNYVGIKDIPDQEQKESLSGDPLEKIAKARGIGYSTLKQQCSGLQILEQGKGLFVQGTEGDIAFFKGMYHDIALHLFNHIEYFVID